MEKLPSGNLRVLSLQRARARTFDPRWLTLIDACLNLLETILSRWEERRDIRRRRERDEKLRRAIEYRRSVPAFTCRLCSKHLR